MSSRRIPELDGIRGIAIALVLIQHYFVSGIIDTTPGTVLSYARAASRLGWSGVNLFFVLSGFLIGGILMDSREEENYFRAFYTRRLFRIVPAYVIVLACYWMTASPRLPWLSYVFYLQNFWMAAKNDLGQFPATWSLAVEEQFYLTLPLVVWLVRPKWIPWIAGGCVGAAIVFRLILTPSLAATVLMPSCMDALMLGVLGAWLVRKKAALPLWTSFSVFSAGMILMAYHSRRGEAGAVFASIGVLWIAAFYLNLILLGVTRQNSALAAFLRLRVLRELGLIAYGVYLTHQLVLTSLIHRSWNPWVTTAAALGITVAVCELSWRYFESPLIKIGHRK